MSVGSGCTCPRGVPCTAATGTRWEPRRWQAQPAPQVADLGRLLRRRPRPVAVVDVGAAPPVTQARLGDPEVLRDLGERRIATTSNSHDVDAALLRVPVWARATSFQRRPSAPQIRCHLLVQQSPPPSPRARRRPRARLDRTHLNDHPSSSSSPPTDHDVARPGPLDPQPRPLARQQVSGGACLADSVWADWSVGGIWQPSGLDDRRGR